MGRAERPWRRPTTGHGTQSVPRPPADWPANGPDVSGIQEGLPVCQVTNTDEETDPAVSLIRSCQSATLVTRTLLLANCYAHNQLHCRVALATGLRIPQLTESLGMHGKQ